MRDGRCSLARTRSNAGIAAHADSTNHRDRNRSAARTPIDDRSSSDAVGCRVPGGHRRASVDIPESAHWSGQIATTQRTHPRRPAAARPASRGAQLVQAVGGVADEARDESACVFVQARWCAFGTWSGSRRYSRPADSQDSGRACRVDDRCPVVVVTVRGWCGRHDVFHRRDHSA